MAAAILPAPAAAQGLYATASAGLGEELTTMAMSTRDPDFLLVGNTRGQVYRTEDGGASWQVVTITPSRTLFFGRERSEDGRQEYALGLPGKSPHLQSWLRRQGLSTAGINLQQLLVTKGDKMVSVNWIEVDRHDDRQVYVGTTDGLYRSSDRGRTYIRIFQGDSTLSERMVNTVATDPSDPRRLLIGTASGLYTSEDRGASFRKTMNYYMRDSYIREIHFEPSQPGLVHVAMGGSAMASVDSGRTWITTHWDEIPAKADVQSLSLGPGNLRLAGTRDGVLASFQGGEMGTWVRRGLRFIGLTVTKVMATDKAPVWLAMTDDAVWGTTDAGLNWNKVFQLGGKELPRWMLCHNGNLATLWILTNRQAYRVGMPDLARGTTLPRSRIRWPHIPKLQSFLVKVLRHNKLYFKDNQRYRERAPWAALLPDISVTATYMPALDLNTTYDYLHHSMPYRYYLRDRDNGINVELWATWDLGRLVFDLREMPHWGRVERNLSGLRQELTERVHRLHTEYRRLAIALAMAPPTDPKTRLLHELRLQEITAYLDALSGGAWSQDIQGGS